MSKAAPSDPILFPWNDENVTVPDFVDAAPAVPPVDAPPVDAPPVDAPPVDAPPAPRPPVALCAPPLPPLLFPARPLPGPSPDEELPQPESSTQTPTPPKKRMTSIRRILAQQHASFDTKKQPSSCADAAQSKKKGAPKDSVPQGVEAVVLNARAAIVQGAGDRRRRIALERGTRRAQGGPLCFGVLGLDPGVGQFEFSLRRGGLEMRDGAERRRAGR
ncbi:MAG TPA: hypothetical protein VIK01_22750 [Polyangiaceae bacterium]